MFGKHFEAAEATVVFIQMRSHGLPKSLYELILDVRTQDGQMFRTSIKEHFAPFLDPSVGDVVQVQYDPKSKVVKVDIKGDTRYDLHAKDLARKAEHDAILAAPAGTPLPQTLAYDAEVSRLTLEAHNKLRNELLLSSSEGTATVLSIQEMGQAVPPLVGYVVEVEVRPRFGGAPFTCEMDAWLDLRTNPITPGSTVQVRYDPQNFFNIIIL
jgi:hypothetical protein